jgi:erythromycin esterase-like protein
MTEEAEAPAAKGRLRRGRFMRLIRDFEEYTNARDSPTDRKTCERALEGLKELARAIDQHTDHRDSLAQAASALGSQSAIIGRCADAFASVILEVLVAKREEQRQSTPADIMNKIIRDSASLRDAPTAETLIERLAKLAKAMNVDLYVHSVDEAPKPKPNDDDDEDDEVAAAAPPPAAPA